MTVAESLLRNREYYQELIQPPMWERTKSYMKVKDGSGTNTKNDIKKLIMDDEFWLKLCALYLKMKPLHHIVKLQGEDVNAAQGKLEWLAARKLYEEGDEELDCEDAMVVHYMDLHWKRINDGIFDASLLLDPRFHAIPKSEESTNNGMAYIKMRFIATYAEDCLTAQVNAGDEIDEVMRANASIAGAAMWASWGENMTLDYMQKQTVHGDYWYNTLGAKHTVEDAMRWLRLKAGFATRVKEGLIARVAMEIVPAPAHNAGCERSFNLLKQIQTMARGALGPQTVDDMVFIGNNLKMHRDLFEELYKVPHHLRSANKRAYVKRDTAYWESVKKTPMKDVIIAMRTQIMGEDADDADDDGRDDEQNEEEDQCYEDDDGEDAYDDDIYDY